jgi:hypothetical protein
MSDNSGSTASDLMHLAGAASGALRLPDPDVLMAAAVNLQCFAQERKVARAHETAGLRLVARAQEGLHECDAHVKGHHHESLVPLVGTHPLKAVDARIRELVVQRQKLEAQKTSGLRLVAGARENVRQCNVGANASIDSLLAGAGVHRVPVVPVVSTVVVVAPPQRSAAGGCGGKVPSQLSRATRTRHTPYAPTTHQEVAAAKLAAKRAALVLLVGEPVDAPSPLAYTFVADTTSAIDRIKAVFVLRRVAKLPEARWFRVPVRTIAYPDYRAKISHPTDLLTIIREVAREEAPTFGKVQASLDQMVQNAVQYNSETSVVPQMARVVRAYVLGGLARAAIVAP